MNYSRIVQYLAAQLVRIPKLANFLQSVVQEISPNKVLVLEYPLWPRQRWDAKHPHQELYAILNEKRDAYQSRLQSFLSFSEHFINIPERQENPASITPYWINGWLPPLDGIALYGFLVNHRPKCYLEVGSGNSTKFARKAISDYTLDTRIISIDPCPRAEINNICDQIIREPAENVAVELFEQLNVNDILFIDGSHRTFMNSDVTMLFLDVIPKLKPGVLVQIHDVTLPCDYPADWVDRYYSEQYLLGSYLLAKGNRFEIILPNYFISLDAELCGTLAPLAERGAMKNIHLRGSSFWIRMT